MNNSTISTEFLLLVERVERIDGEIKDLQADKKDVMAEAKSRGFDGPAFREILRIRKMKPETRRQHEAIVDTYKAMLGMLDGTPLGRWAIEKLSKLHSDQGKEDDRPGLDELYATAVELVVRTRKASTSWLQRQLQIGFNAAAALIERMEREGVVSHPDQAGRREVLSADPAEAGQPSDDETPIDAPSTAPQATIEDARRMGTDAAHAGAAVTANPFPPFDERRAAWDEAWCAALGSDGMDIPEALRPTPKPKKGAAADAADGEGADA
jgi:uncharacterized protein (UPF0335 family)